MINPLDYSELVKQIVGTYKGRCFDHADLKQEAWIGVIEATRRCRNINKFETYANISVRGNISEYLSNSRMIRVPYHAKDLAEGRDALDLKRSYQDVGYIDSYTDDELVVQLLSLLSDRESEVIVLRYGLDGSEPRRPSEVAYILSISHTHAVRCERQALERLRNAFPINGKGEDL